MLLVISVIISVRVPESGVCVHISGEDRVWYVCDVLYAVNKQFELLEFVFDSVYVGM